MVMLCPFVEPRFAPVRGRAIHLEECTLSERAAAASASVRSFSLSHRAHWHERSYGLHEKPVQQQEASKECWSTDSESGSTRDSISAHAEESDSASEVRSIDSPCHSELDQPQALVEDTVSPIASQHQMVGTMAANSFGEAGNVWMAPMSPMGMTDFPDLGAQMFFMMDTMGYMGPMGAPSMCALQQQPCVQMPASFLPAPPMYAPPLISEGETLLPPPAKAASQGGSLISLEELLR